MNRMMTYAALLLVLMIARPASAQDSSPGVGDSSYVAGEYRVFTGAGEPASIDDIVAAMGDYTVVFVGEAHDDPTGHMLEAELYRRAYDAYGSPGSNGGAPHGRG